MAGVWNAVFLCQSLPPQYWYMMADVLLLTWQDAAMRSEKGEPAREHMQDLTPVGLEVASDWVLT